MKRFVRSTLSIAVALSVCVPAVAAPTFQEKVTYIPTLTPAERTKIHAQVEALSGDVGNAIAGDGSYNPLTLVGAMLDGGSYDSISRGAGGGGTPTAYPFPVNNNTNNQNEYDRKTAKLAWLVGVAQAHGFPVVVQRQPDKYVYVEIGDPDAPEMVMALSHLDSPTASVSAAQLNRWRGADGLLGSESAYYPDSYHTPYVKDGWIYGAGIQDDSGPTLATMLAAKALMEAGLPRDRRIRIVMGIYEDGGPGTPSVTNTSNFISAPYYTANPSFYDNWAYKMLNREEMPIAAYTSDSRFPVIVGNSVASTPAVSMSLSSDAGKPFSLVAAVAGVTLRADDPTLKDIAYGSTTQIASRAIFTLDVAGVSAEDTNAFVNSINAAATAQGWLPASPTEIPKVKAEVTGDNVVLEINTGVAMEMPTPQYGKNAVVWGMHLLSEALGARGITSADLQLKKAADGVADLFFRGGVEGEAYIGRNMGIAESLLRNPDNGAPNLTFALMGGINSENLASFYAASTGNLSIPMYMRSMHTNAADYNDAVAAVRSAWENREFTLGTINPFSNPTLYMTHDNPLIALQLASYRGSMNHDPAAFEDVYGLLDLEYAQGTTGGTLAGNFRNKMNAFGAVIPGNERWWHTANERMKVISAVQMTKLMADGMLEMARYTGPAGAKVMWADIPGLNADRADLDLLDVTIGTYKDAWDTVLPSHLGKDVLFAATSFNIPMWNGRGNTSPTAAAFAAGHGTGGVYLPLNDPDFVANTFVLPMKLEFKVARPANATDAEWNFLRNGGYQNFSFNVLKGGNVVPLKASDGQSADKFFYKRVSAYDPNSLYVSVNVAITDDSYQGVGTVVADSKTDLYAVNPNYLASNPNPFPERGAREQRGFFLFGDGSKDAEFTSPEAVYVTLPATVQECSAAPAVANTLLDSIGFKGSRGGIAKAVASEMGSHADDENGSMFWGIDYCVGGQPNPYYEAAVKSFLRTKFGLNV